MHASDSGLRLCMPGVGQWSPEAAVQVLHISVDSAAGAQGTAFLCSEIMAERFNQ